ncbi:MAG: AI-2E family transporter [Verrucomicrobiota bacterium]|nr:AI-2E family transporter [Verrucomicrobiota bacterium]
MMRVNKINASSSALNGIFSVLLTAFVITVLYFGREILVPLALAVMLTFLLSPLVSRIERFIGRIAAVLIVVAMLFGLIGGAGYLLTHQMIDLAAKLPNYQANIETKLRSVRLPSGGVLGRLTNSVDELQKQLPTAAEPTAGTTDTTPADRSRIARATPTPMPVRVVESQSKFPGILQSVAAGVLGPLGTAGLVLLLVIFMLFKREDLRGRLIRLVGQGRISATTRAIDDAGKRVARYLAMQCLVNVGFGFCIATGLYFIGLPNAVLWGAFAAIMRFIPYVGAWIAAAVPLCLSFAASTSWLAPILVLALFLGLELTNANVLEPWLYGASTGVSSIALIVAAVFWTWIWGPVGLLLSTPLTVCLAVMGRHVPKLQFLSVLLSEEQALAPHEEIYYRLLRQGLAEGSTMAETYVRTHSLTALYDNVLIPTVTLAETDAQREELDDTERAAMHQHIHDIVEDLGTMPKPAPEVPADKIAKAEAPVPLSAPTCSVLSIPARAYRDELGGLMLTQLLQQQGFHAENAPAALATAQLIELARKGEWEAICVSVVAPSTQIHARFITAKLRAALPNAKLLVGAWGASEGLPEITERLRVSGADEVVVSLAEAVVQLAKFSVPGADEMIPAPIPANEEARLAELAALRILDTLPEDAFNRITEKASRVFEAPIALVSFIDRDRQWFKAETGLPTDLAEQGETSRDVSVCGHVVATDQTMVIEDIARDRRFAKNPFLRERGIRFYAGAPLRWNGHPLGSLCIMDVKPRRLAEREQRLLEVMAEDVVEEIGRRVARGPVAAAA